MKKLFYLFSLLLYIAIISFNIYKITTYASTSANHTKIIVAVFNTDGAPIDNACICIIEDQTYTNTNKNGYTDPILISTSNYDSHNRQTITILAYKNGFASHIKHNVSIYKNQTRTGIIITTYEILNETDLNVITTYEKNPKSVDDEIIKKYKRGSF